MNTHSMRVASRALPAAMRPCACSSWGRFLRCPVLLSVLASTVIVLSPAGAAEPDAKLRELAVRYIQSALKFEATPAVRAQAIEAVTELKGELQPLIREHLKDPHPGVRFAACLGVGKVRDAAARATVQGLLKDADPSVRIGAYFALERLGDGSYRKPWADALLHDKEPVVRRNAVLAMGQLEDPALLTLLRRAADQDRDEGVRVQAMEGLAVLGDTQAINYFVRDSFGGMGYRQPFALLALGRTRDEHVMATLRSRLGNSPYIEARLAAARSLGRRGSPIGYDLAIGSLTWNSPQRDLPDDLPENQVMRVRTMAAMALGDIGDARALPQLKSRMQTPDDPRVQLAAARSILVIMDRLAARDARG